MIGKKRREEEEEEEEGKIVIPLCNSPPKGSKLQ